MPPERHRRGSAIHIDTAIITFSKLAGEVAFLRKFIGFRLANIYDINARVRPSFSLAVMLYLLAQTLLPMQTYMLKLAKTGEGSGEKAFVVLESGIRFHSTQWVRDKNATPSNFCLKLRKHLRSRRLEDVRQLGSDRVIDLTFGAGAACHHLILELYAQASVRASSSCWALVYSINGMSQGNVVLTDAVYNILVLLRSHRDDQKQVAFMANHPYPIHTIRLRSPATPEQLAAALASADAKATFKGMLSSVLKDA